MKMKRAYVAAVMVTALTGAAMATAADSGMGGNGMSGGTHAVVPGRPEQGASGADAAMHREATMRGGTMMRGDAMMPGGMMNMMGMMGHCGATIGSGAALRLPAGNEKLQLQMQAEIMQKTGEILAKYAARLPDDKRAP